MAQFIRELGVKRPIIGPNGNIIYGYSTPKSNFQWGSFMIIVKPHYITIEELNYSMSKKKLIVFEDKIVNPDVTVYINGTIKHTNYIYVDDYFRIDSTFYKLESTVLQPWTICEFIYLYDTY